MYYIHSSEYMSGTVECKILDGCRWCVYFFFNHRCNTEQNRDYYIVSWLGNSGGCMIGYGQYEPVNKTMEEIYYMWWYLYLDIKHKPLQWESHSVSNGTHCFVDF